MRKPKIVFKPISLQDNIDNIIWTYFDSEFHDITCETYPELYNIDEKLSKSEKENIIRSIFTRYYNQNIDVINKEVKKYSELWNKYNDEYMSVLSEYLNIEWNIDEIVAYVGIVCVCPRYLDEHSFVIGINFPLEYVLRVCAHETLHFLWFEKWKTLYKDYKRSDFESPNIIWRYSEMVVDPIINSKKINKIIHENEKAYDYFYDLVDGKEKVMNKLVDIYSKDDTIENKIKKGFDYIKEYYNKE